MSNQRLLFSQIHPIFYKVSVTLRRLQRKLVWQFGEANYAAQFDSNPLPFRIKKHQSVLIRKLGDSDQQLQINKITNLKIAAKQINGIVIRPGETFSFCKLVGNPTSKKGYLEGMELSFGKARPGIGGGICQIANLIHWLVIHSPLTVIERSQHSFDPFPDQGRVLPFGSGAAVFYNYIDYQFKNETAYSFQINLWFTDKCIEGELRIDQELDFVYHVFEKEHAFLKIENDYFRKNEIWRNKCLKFESGKVVATELLTKNFAKLAYVPTEKELNPPSKAN